MRWLDSRKFLSDLQTDLTLVCLQKTTAWHRQSLAPQNEDWDR